MATTCGRGAFAQEEPAAATATGAAVADVGRVVEVRPLAVAVNKGVFWRAAVVAAVLVAAAAAVAMTKGKADAATTQGLASRAANTSILTVMIRLRVAASRGR